MSPSKHFYRIKNHKPVEDFDYLLEVSIDKVKGGEPLVRIERLCKNYPILIWTAFVIIESMGEGKDPFIKRVGI